MRKAFVDLGASWGHVSKKFSDENPDFEIFCIEVNPKHLPSLQGASASAKRPFNIIQAAAWTHDGEIELFESGALAASTIVSGKIEPGHWPQIDYTKPTRTQSLDISHWLLRNFREGDEIVLKIDIEGAEYAVLSKMAEDGSLRLMKKVICEWHQDRFPDISLEKHNQIRNMVIEQVPELVDWK